MKNTSHCAMLCCGLFGWELSRSMVECRTDWRERMHEYQASHQHHDRLYTVQVLYQVRIPSMSTQHRYKARTIDWIDAGDDRMARRKKSQDLFLFFLWLLFLIKIRICVPVPGEWSGEGQQARIFSFSSVHLYCKISSIEKGLIELQKKKQTSIKYCMIDWKR